VRRRVFGRQSAGALAAPADFGGRLGAAGSRLLLELLPFGAYTVVTLGLAALLFGGADRTFHATYATCAAIVIGAAMLSQFVLSPGAPALRLLPLEDRAARFLHRSFLWVSGVGVFAWLTAGLLIRTGVPLKARLVIELITGAAVGLTVLAVIVLARRMVAEAIRGGAGAGRLRARLADTWHWFAIAYLAAIWLFWAASLLDQGPSTVWAAIASVAMVLAFPLADRWIGRGIDDMLGGTDYARVLRRIMRVLLAVVLFAAVNELWGFNTFGEAQVRLRQAVLASSLDLVAALALALVGWQLVKVGIDGKLKPREVNGVLVEPSQRMRTLLPLLRNFVVVALIVMTAMLLLSGLGVNIGPLLAGAGVVGLAIGFGAQTLVKDILTGFFFLVDDAFRVGEYIVSGSYKGSVEAITLRSLKLRHHRGPLYTVPFGELKAVQNLSRDWVIDKLTLGITYDSDLDKAKKLIKKIGQELAQDPELAPGILETLKMQGVEEFGDFAIQIRLKFMTKPGGQFAVRRRAYSMIKKAFDANGIKFAFPTVQVAGGGDSAVAVARQGLAMTQQQEPAA
jgi:small-conductance mechanosensitive channel